LLRDQQGRVSIYNWEQIRALLPAELQDMFKFSEHVEGAGCWTCHPTETMPASAMPLTIAGKPVVIPVEHTVPLRAPIGAQLDPYAERLDPSRVITKAAASVLFSHFQDALGFYILLDGHLQIIVPPDFDYVWAHDQQPTQFGGLNVCYISDQSLPRPTALLGHSQHNAHYLSRDAWVIGSRSGKKSIKPMQSHIGVRTKDVDGDIRFTIPTHLVAKALEYEGQSIGLNNIQNMPIYADKRGCIMVRFQALSET
jgi:hypothetical protein